MEKNTQQDCEQLLKKYKNALLFNKKLDSLKSEILKNFSEERFKTISESAERWVNECKTLGEKAILIAKSGAKRDSLEFDDLQKQALKLGGNAKAYLCEVFDKTEKSLHSDVSKSHSPLEKLFLELRKYSSWGDNGKTKVEEITESITSVAPNEKDRIDKEIKLGKLAADYYEKAYKLGSQRKSSEFDELQKEMTKAGLGQFEKNKLKSQYEKGFSAFKRYLDMKKISKKNKKHKTDNSHDVEKLEPKKGPVEISCINFEAINPNFVASLKPAAKWTVLFDETGNDFSDSDGATNKNSGKGVMLVVPEYTTLPDLHPKWHAVNESAQEIWRVIELIQDSQCGIIGMPCAALAKIHRDRWFSCIETLLDLLLRLLPIDGQTEIQLFVEQRGDATSENRSLLEKTCTDALFHLSRVHPRRAEAIRITSKIISKNEHKWNGYVDAAAYIWSSSLCKQLLSISNWKDTCFLGATYIDDLRYYLDYFTRESSILPNDWSVIISEAVGRANNSILQELLRCLGEQAREYPALWEEYLRHTVAYLNSKAINMPILSAKISWLQRWQPIDCTLPPKLRLIWLTAKLAEENHRGCVNTFPEQRQEFLTLSEQLFEEDAPLTCNAALNMAVSYTDEFDFKKAREILSPWENRPPEVAGLQYYGRLQSSLGQNEAFVGNNGTAVKYFKTAFSAFSKLSDCKSARLDIDQTLSYLLTVLMDSNLEDKAIFHDIASKYFGDKIENVASKLGCSNDDVEKYHHHILLRYLTCEYADERERNIYLATKGDWSTGEGHPWELIEFYRACLCSSEEEKLEHLNRAYEIAMTGSGTLHVIAAVIVGAILLLEPHRSSEYQELLERCEREIPLLGDRANVLREHVHKKYNPLELAKLVLPFNFR